MPGSGFLYRTLRLVARPATWGRHALMCSGVRPGRIRAATAPNAGYRERHRQRSFPSSSRRMDYAPGATRGPGRPADRGTTGRKGGDWAYEGRTQLRKKINGRRRQ